MKTKVTVVVLCALAILAISRGATRHSTFGAHSFWADGTGPTPPPVPVGAFPTPSSGLAVLADGTGPTPPPVPVKAFPAAASEPTYLADGTGPTPPPVPMQAA